jgi:hypothetical protein
VRSTRDRSSPTVQRRKPCEVAAGRKAAAAARQEDGSGLGLALEIGEETDELAVEQVVDRVLRTRRVFDRDPEHAIATLEAERSIG